MQIAVINFFRPSLVCLLLKCQWWQRVKSSLASFEKCLLQRYISRIQRETQIKQKLPKKYFFVSVVNEPIILHFRVKAVNVFYDFALFLVDQPIYLFSGCFSKANTSRLTGLGSGW